MNTYKKVVARHYFQGILGGNDSRFPEEIPYGELGSDTLSEVLVESESAPENSISPIYKKDGKVCQDSITYYAISSEIKTEESVLVDDLSF